VAAPGEGRSVDGDGRIVVSRARWWSGLLILALFALSLFWQARTGTNRPRSHPDRSDATAGKAVMGVRW
jgi:hypothetical protein